MKTIILLSFLTLTLSFQSCSPDVLDDINDDSRNVPTQQQPEKLPADQPE